MKHDSQCDKLSIYPLSPKYGASVRRQTCEKISIKNNILKQNYIRYTIYVYTVYMYTREIDTCTYTVYTTQPYTCIYTYIYK